MVTSGEINKQSQPTDNIFSPVQFLGQQSPVCDHQSGAWPGVAHPLPHVLAEEAKTQHHCALHWTKPMMWYISNTNNTWCDDGSINLKFKWKHSKSSHYHLRNVLLVSSWWLVLLSSNCVQTLDISDKPIYHPVNTFKWLFQVCILKGKEKGSSLW